MTPRFFTQGFTEVKSPRYTFGVLWESDGPNAIISVLLSLKLRKFKDNLAFTSDRQYISVSGPLELYFKGKQIWVSSAEQWKDRPCFLKIEPNGSIYNEKRIGAKIDPWGTPNDKEATPEEYSPILTLKLWLEKYDLNHSRALPFMPTQCSRRVSRIAWSTVSKAVLKSKSTSTAWSPASPFNRISFKTLEVQSQSSGVF